MPSDLERLSAAIHDVADAGKSTGHAIQAAESEVLRILGQLPTTNPPSSRALREALYTAQRALAQAGTVLHDFNSTTARFADGLAQGGGTGAGGAGSRHVGTERNTEGAALPGGVSMVALSDIDDSDRSLSEANFTKGHSPDDLAWAHEAFREVVLPGVRAGKTIDDFRDLDATRGLMGTRSYASTYSGFFGDDDAIRLEALPGGGYHPENGYHRLWVARRLGLTHIPARKP